MGRFQSKYINECPRLFKASTVQSRELGELVVRIEARLSHDALSILQTFWCPVHILRPIDVEAPSRDLEL
jgi:hypothetical protein